MTDYCQPLEDGSVLLTVNQRLARHHLLAYQQWQLANGNLWWETPRILPVRAWFKSLHAQLLASGQTHTALLPELLQQKAWRECIEQDSALELLDVDAATRGARQAWEIACAWQCLPEADDYLPLDQQSWQRWHARYSALLQERQWVDEVSLPNLLQALMSRGVLPAELPGQVILDGFLQLPPQLTLFFNTLSETGVEVVHRQTTAKACVHVISHEDDAQELLTIATQMRAELEWDSEQSLGLVVPDLQKKRAGVLRAFDRVFFPTASPRQISDAGRPYDLSIGQPLADTAVIKSALLILKLCAFSIEGNDISALLLGPYTEAAQTESRRREQLDRRLREQRQRSLTLEKLQLALHEQSKLAPAIKRLIESRHRAPATLSEWAERYTHWLASLGWPGQGLDTEEFQAVSSWRECLDDLQLLDDNAAVRSGDALTLINRLARERIFQLETPNTPIQIMGRLESHGIEFDCLWVSGLDAEQWPPAGSPSPFLPMERQKAAGVPNASAQARLALAQLEYQKWCSQAPLVVASRARTRDGKMLDAAEVPLMPSAVTGDRAAACIERLQNTAPWQDPVRQLHHSLSLVSVVDDHGPALAAGSAVRGGARLFENQALCPFKAFALHRLNIRPLEEVGLGLDPRQHGNLLHASLELFWASVKTQAALLEMEPAQRQHLIDSCIQTAIDDITLPESLRLLEVKRLNHLIDEWLTHCEARRQPFHVMSLEQKQTIEHGGIVMSVTLDRIDNIDGQTVVIDYKTGTSSRINTWADERIVNPQLPLYVLTSEETQGASFAQVARNQCKFLGVTSTESLLPGVKTTVRKSQNPQATTRELETWQDWRVHWQEALDAVALEVRQGLASVTPMKNACLHCDLKPLCRISDDPVAEDEDTAVNPFAAASGIEEGHS